METKIIQVFYDKDGYPFKDAERTVRFPIIGSGFQGASNTTKIRFYYGELGDSGLPLLNYLMAKLVVKS